MKRISISPRKKPQQERSKATRDVLLQAAAYILEREGWEGFTTNRVAERAGVNIASLYQYFPNKQAILAALRHAHVEESRQAVLAASAEVTDPLAAMVRAVIAAHQVAPKLHRAFTEELPRRVLPEGGECMNDLELLNLVAPFFQNTADPALTLFITRSAIHAVIHEAACHRPELLRHPLFESELLRLLRAYLKSARAGGRAAKTRQTAASKPAGSVAASRRSDTLPTRPSQRVAGTAPRRR